MFLATIVGLKRASLGLFLGTLMWAAGAEASTVELRVERKRSDESFNAASGESIIKREQIEVLFISESAARLDTESVSIIVRDDVFVWVDHDAKAYVEIILPLQMEDLLGSAEQDCFRSFPQAFDDAQASVTSTGEQTTLGRWKASQQRIEGHLRKVRFEVDRWTTEDLPIDLGAYHLLVRSRAALSPLYRGWVEQLITKGGFLVRSKAILHGRGGVKVSEIHLKTIDQIEADESRYSPPHGYSQTLDRPPLDIACVSPPGQ